MERAHLAKRPCSLPSLSRPAHGSLQEANRFKRWHVEPQLVPASSAVQPLHSHSTWRTCKTAASPQLTSVLSITSEIFCLQTSPEGSWAPCVPPQKYQWHIAEPLPTVPTPWGAIPATAALFSISITGSHTLLPAAAALLTHTYPPQGRDVAEEMVFSSRGC